MSVLGPTVLVKPFAAVFASTEALINEGLAGLSSILGQAPDLVSPPFALVETDYYEKEMGPGLVKLYASWPELRPAEELCQIKLAAMALEQSRSLDGRRLFNLDPGYIFSGGLVLSTGKFRGHRLPLGRGVWGELTLNFHRGAFLAFPWTYLDYQKPEVQLWLTRMRRAALDSLRSGGQGGCQRP